MSLELILTSIIFLIFVIFIVLYFVRKRKISIKYSLIWIFPSLILMLFTLVPGVMTFFTKLTGFQTASNMIISALVCLLMLINLVLTVIVTNQKEKIRLLIQEVSIIKEQIKELKK